MHEDCRRSFIQSASATALAKSPDTRQRLWFGFWRTLNVSEHIGHLPKKVWYSLANITIYKKTATITQR